MPYIPEKRREELLEGHLPTVPGDLAYIISQVVKDFLGPNPRYEDYARAIGALELTKLEIVRRLINPHEDDAMDRNGDCF